MVMKFTTEIKENLTKTFDESEIKFKPTAIKDGNALALAYVDARTILDRLDEAVGIENWNDDYEVVSPNKVICKLTIFGITKSDAGESHDTDKEPLKSAVSDALKRAAVKFGIARYLYRLPKTWCKYDNSKNEFLEIPDMEKRQANFKISKKNDVKNNDSVLPIPECTVCGEKITNRVAIFSKKYYQKPLCMKCQTVILHEKETADSKEAVSSNN
jgi:hypothetical protein